MSPTQPRISGSVARAPFCLEATASEYAGTHPLAIVAVGQYAIRLAWSDGHASGVYSYDYLRRICPCSKCYA